LQGLRRNRIDLVVVVVVVVDRLSGIEGLHLRRPFFSLQVERG
jgi:hypothetical protein